MTGSSQSATCASRQESQHGFLAKETSEGHPRAATSKETTMSALDNAKQALEDAGTQLKADLWTPDDKRLLEQRARDLAELAAKAAAASDPAHRAAYLAAAQGTVTAVKV